MAGILQKTANAVSSRYTVFLESLTPEQRQLFDTFLFLMRFAALSIPLYLVLGSGWESAWLRSFNASVSAVVLSFAGIDVSTVGSVIYGEFLTLDVSWDSTGWKSMMAFSALVLASTVPSRQKLAGIIIGAGFIQVANIARITSMFYAVEVYHVDYELLHTVLWRWGLTTVVLVTWIGWLYGDRVRAAAARYAPW